MKILILNYECPPIGGGGGKATYLLAKYFAKKGHQVDYITSGFEGLKKKETIDNINIFRVNVIVRKRLETANFLSMFFYILHGFFLGMKLCKNNNYDLINTQFVLPTGPLGYVLSKLFNVKNILSIHGGDIYDPSKKSSPHKHWFFRKIISFLMNNSDAIVAQSNNTKQNALKYYNIKKNIKIIPLPYEKFQFEKIDRKMLGLKKDKVYIVGLGRLIKRKGFEYFIEAISKLEKNVEGIIIGGGHEKNNLLELSKKLKINNRIHLLGNISENKKFQYLAVADIFVLSSLHEGFGIMLQEAMQIGMPIIATNHGGQLDLIKDNYNGILLEPKNSELLSKKIKILLKDNKLREQMIKNNLNTIKNFDPKKISSEYLTI